MDPRRSSRRYRVPVWLAVSALVHGVLVIVAIETRFQGFSATGQNAMVRSHGGGEAASDVDPACLLDEVLAAAARASVCLLPGASYGSRDACLSDSLSRFDSGRLACVSMAKPIDITMIDLPSFPTNMEEEEKQRIEEKKKLAEEDEASWSMKNETVVDVPRPEVEVRPDQTDHRGEFDNKVEKETKHYGKPVPSGNGVAGTDPRVLRASNPSPEPAVGGREGTPGATTAVSPQQSAVGGGRIASSSGETGAADGLEVGAGGTQPKRGKGLGVTIDPITGARPGGDGGDGKPKTDLRPSGDAIARAASGTYDHLEDIDEGEETLLNTKRFKYASFFNRVKRAVWENWHADRVYALRDPDGKIYGVKDRLTVLKVSLRPDGSLANVIVEKPCGVDFLDDEAVSAFKKAQPFPNPPGGLVDEESKLITFRFGFTLEIMDRPSWKIVRYQ